MWQKIPASSFQIISEEVNLIFDEYPVLQVVVASIIYIFHFMKLPPENVLGLYSNLRQAIKTKQELTRTIQE